MDQLKEFHDFERRYELMFRVYNTDLKTRSRNRAQEDHLKNCFRRYMQHLFDQNLFYSTHARQAFANETKRYYLYLGFLTDFSWRFSNNISWYLKHSAEFYH
jgi:hypothetical protein